LLPADHDKAVKVMAIEGLECFEAIEFHAQAALFATELGWMTCGWLREQLQCNSFGHMTRDEAVRALRASSLLPFCEVWQVDVESLGEGWRPIRPTSAMRGLAQRLQRYATQFSDDFLDVELSWGGVAPFARRVLEACRQIPIGETISYAELARLAGSPAAARAAGNTMARNRCPLIVPCHRVVGANGRLGGYSAPQGLAMKRRLLSAEARTRSLSSAS
jgi:O-6-methylguanine DNA methyltransferase